MSKIWIIPVSLVDINFSLFQEKFRQKIKAELIPLLKVHIFSPLGSEKILIIVPLQEHVASLSASLLRHIFNIGLLCAFICVDNKLMMLDIKYHRH